MSAWERGLEGLFRRAALHATPRRFMAFTLAFSVVIGIVVALFGSLFWGWSPLVSGPIAFLMICITAIVMVVLRADARANLVENALPDALDLMAANLRAGLSTDRALILASRPEFGPLQEELDRTGREIALGKNATDALRTLGVRLGSERAQKALNVVATGLRAGGKLAELLGQTSAVLKQQTLVERKVKSAVTSYVIFIIAAVCMGAPFLFATSSFLVEVLSGILGTLELGATPAGFVPIAIQGGALPIGLVVPFAVVLLSLVGFMSALIIGQISRGRARAGLAYAPVIMLVSLGLFFVFRAFVKLALGSTFL